MNLLSSNSMKPITSFTLLLLVTAYPAFSQSNLDLTGTWSGMVQVPLGKPLIGEYTLTQDGASIAAVFKTKTINGKDSTEYKMSGAIAGDDIHLEPTEFVYKAFGACLAVSDLQYSKVNGQEKLTGRWHGDLKLSTCPAGLSGKVEVVRLKNTEPEQVTEPIAIGDSSQTVHVNKDDYDGTALVNELKKQKYYALIIGESEYADDAIEDLDRPVKDASEFQDVLEKYYTFDSQNVTLLTNPTRAQIIESFDALSKKVTDRDQFLIFYAGHGVWDPDLKQGYWLPSDASLDSKAQWLSNSTIRDYVGGIDSKHTLLITDACFSGGIFKERGVSFADSKAMLEMYRLPSRKAMTSGALKSVPDKSVFVAYLIKDLINNTQPLLSAEDLFRTFKIAVINNSPDGQVPQYGAIGQVGDEGGDFIFLKRD